MNKFKDEKGVTLLALTITIIVMVIITTTLITNTKNHLKIEKTNNLYSDIEQIKDKVSEYYIRKGKLPIKEEAYCTAYELVDILKTNGVDSEKTMDDLLDVNDKKSISEATYYVINLSDLDNLTLNYGSEYKNWTSGTGLQDLYIINEKSHQIYYPKGIIVDGITYYSYNITLKGEGELTEESLGIEGINVYNAVFEDADSNNKLYIASKGKASVKANLEVKVPSGTVLKNAYHSFIKVQEEVEQEKPNSFTKCAMSKVDDILDTENDTYKINITSDKLSFGSYVLWIRIEDQYGNEIVTSKSTAYDIANEITIEEKQINLSISEAKELDIENGLTATRN